MEARTARRVGSTSKIGATTAAKNEGYDVIEFYRVHQFDMWDPFTGCHRDLGQ